MLCGCANKDAEKSDTTSDSAADSGQTSIESVVSEDEKAAEKLIKEFAYDELPVPETLMTADHIYCCYSDSNSVILSVCAKRDKEVNDGPSNKTQYLALYNKDITELKSINVSFSDSYVTTAVPYKNGVAYVGYNEMVDNNADDISEKYYAEWYVVYSDGENELILDKGICHSYYDIPHLFISENKVCCLWGHDSGYVVKQIEDDKPVLLFEETDSLLCSVDVYSNGKEFCFLVSYPESRYATFAVCDLSGKKYEYALQGKVTSFAIMDDYAVCGTGDEESGYFFVETVKLSDGSDKAYRVPDSAYCLRGNGGDLVFVNMNWSPYYTDVVGESTVSMTLPSHGKHCLFYPLGESTYFVLGTAQTQDNGDVYKFYRLTID